MIVLFHFCCSARASVTAWNKESLLLLLFSGDAPWRLVDGFPRLRRQLEGRGLRMGLDSDRQAYRQLCRVANNLTTKSVHSSNAQRLRLSTSLPVMSGFCVGVNNLFHSSSSTSLAVGAFCLDRCNSIWAYFVENLDDILRLIRVKLDSAVTKHFADPAHVGPSLSDLSPVTPVEAAKKITSVKSKTPSQDILPMVILEKCVDSFAIVITRPTNISFEQAVFTTAFEMAQITLLLKKLIRDPEFPSYYCSPISTPFQR